MLLQYLSSSFKELKKKMYFKNVFQCPISIIYTQSEEEAGVHNMSGLKCVE